jgi:hypothetical protein
MNPIKERIRKRLNELPSELEPIRDACLRYLHRCCAVGSDDTLLVGHQPWDGLHSYLCRLFPGAKKTWFARYSKLHGLQIPPTVRRFLSCANGATFFGLSIFGMSPSMLQDPPLMNRSVVQCLDVSEANTFWKHEYRAEDTGFHFGSRDFSDTEVLGYFVGDCGGIRAIRKSGEVVGEWMDVTTFLKDELPRAEKLALESIASDWWE